MAALYESKVTNESRGINISSKLIKTFLIWKVCAWTSNTLVYTVEIVKFKNAKLKIVRNPLNYFISAIRHWGEFNCLPLNPFCTLFVYKWKLLRANCLRSVGENRTNDCYDFNFNIPYFSLPFMVAFTFLYHKLFDRKKVSWHEQFDLFLVHRELWMKLRNPGPSGIILKRVMTHSIGNSRVAWTMLWAFLNVCKVHKSYAPILVIFSPFPTTL